MNEKLVSLHAYSVQGQASARSVNFEMSFWCLQFLPKNEQKQVDLRFHSSKVEFVCSFFGGNVCLKKSFQLCLTFSRAMNRDWLNPVQSWPNLVTAQSHYELMALRSFLVLQQSAPLFSQ